MSMNKRNTVEAHVSSTPLVICVGNESRMWEFEENGFPAFVYRKLSRDLEYSGAPTFGDPPSPVSYNANSETERLDRRLY